MLDEIQKIFLSLEEEKNGNKDENNENV
jgi:hypothetical protein